MNEVKTLETPEPATQLRDPNPDELETPEFNAVWNAIKRWDLERWHGDGYHGATGTDVVTILDALRQAGRLS